MTAWLIWLVWIFLLILFYRNYTFWTWMLIFKVYGLGKQILNACNMAVRVKLSEGVNNNICQKELRNCPEIEWIILHTFGCVYSWVSNLAVLWACEPWLTVYCNYSVHLLQLQPGFDSRARHPVWVKFVVGSCPCSDGFSGHSPVFLPLQKPSVS